MTDADTVRKGIEATKAVCARRAEGLDELHVYQVQYRYPGADSPINRSIQMLDSEYSEETAARICSVADTASPTFWRMVRIEYLVHLRGPVGGR